MSMTSVSKSEAGRAFAGELDEQDPLRTFRNEFIIPTKKDLKSRSLARLTPSSNEIGDDTIATEGTQSCIYLCGNSLGLQPKRTLEHVVQHLSVWAQKGVLGHFAEHEDTISPPFLHVDDVAAKLMAPIVGALQSEVAVMETLTANLHLLMESFYQPTKEKYKILLEGKAFPSDHYAVESQIRTHGFDPKDAMVLIEPDDRDSATMSTSHIKSMIDKHAPSTALILLPGVQFYTGQYLDIKAITEHAHFHGIHIGWDLAHAVGNVDVRLHDWDVDFAAWCNYKYMNAGPGAVAGLYVHSKHGEVDYSAIKDGKVGYRSRLCGWWGSDKASRFEMGTNFLPIPGAQGFQLGNPSALGLTAVIASLEIFAETNMSTLRQKSIRLTQYLYDLLTEPPISYMGKQLPFTIITPDNPLSRGAQLSVRLKPGLLESVMRALEEAGVVVDERRPDVVRVAPAPLYNTFSDVWDFVIIFLAACERAELGLRKGGAETLALGGKDDKAWAQIK